MVSLRYYGRHSYYFSCFVLRFEYSEAIRKLKVDKVNFVTWLTCCLRTSLVGVYIGIGLICLFISALSFYETTRRLLHTATSSNTLRQWTVMG